MKSFNFQQQGVKVVLLHSLLAVAIHTVTMDVHTITWDIFDTEKGSSLP